MSGAPLFITMNETTAKLFAEYFGPKPVSPDCHQPKVLQAKEPDELVGVWFVQKDGALWKAGPYHVDHMAEAMSAYEAVAVGAVMVDLWDEERMKFEETPL